MPYPTPIEWTDATWTCVGGCDLAGPECTHCYAMTLAGTRLKHHPLYAGTTVAGKAGPVFNGHLTAAPDDADVWTWPLRWRGAKEPKLGPGKPSLIFVDDMSDLFHEQRPTVVIDRTVSTIIHSRHIGQLLTKRPALMKNYLVVLRDTPERVEWSREEEFTELALAHLWLGFSAGGQRWFDERWPYMRDLAAMGFTIFCSYEPALEPLVLPPDFLALGRRAQLICGGESGPKARPMNPDWARALRDQCKAAGVPYFFKQWGSHGMADRGDPSAFWLDGYGKKFPYIAYDESTSRVFTLMKRIGKKSAGRLLDGVEHNEFPEVIW